MRRQLALAFAASLMFGAASASADENATFTCNVSGMVGGVVNSLGSPAIGVTLTAEGWQVVPGAGCDLQLGRYLIGGNVDYAFGKASSADITLRDNWSASARFGYFVQPETMLYVRAGVAGESLKFIDATNSRSGLLLGAGLEAKLFDKTWFRFDYSHSNFASTDGANHPASHAVRAGFVLKFGGDR